MMLARAERSTHDGAPGGPAALVGRATTMSDSPSDRSLLERIAAGDREAFRLFYDRYAPKVLAYVRALGRARDAAEDVVQEVFLAVHRRAGTYRPERGEVAGWLYTITRNKLVDLWRQRPVGDDAPEVDFARLLVDEGGAERKVVSLSVRKALSGLKREQRQAVELAYFGGLTYEETAERLQLPLGTLKSRIRAGLALMRQELAGGGS